MDIYAKRTMNLGKVLSGIKTRMNKVDRILYRFHQKEKEDAMASAERFNGVVKEVMMEI